MKVVRERNIVGKLCGQSPLLFLFYLYLILLGWSPIFQNVAGLTTLRIDEVFLIFVVAILLPLMMIMKKGQVPFIPRIFVNTWGVYLFLVCCSLLGQALSIKVEALNPLWTLTRLFMLTLIFYFSYLCARRYKKNINSMVSLFLTIALSIAVLGILQWFDLAGISSFVERYYPRVTTYVPTAATAVFGGNPTIMGTFLTIAISFLSARLFAYRETRLIKATLWLALGAFFLALFLTGSKLAIILGMLMPILLLSLLRKKRFQLLVKVAVASVGALWLVNVFAPYALMRVKLSLAPSVLGRWEVWNYLIGYVLSDVPSFFFGNAFRSQILGVSDNAYIHELLHYGAIGTFGYIAFIFINLFFLLSMLRKSHVPYERALYAGAFGMFLSIMIFGIAYATISAERLSEFIFVLLGITYGANKTSPCVKSNERVLRGCHE